MGVKVRAPGSCGELVQGTIDGQNFLITCPIDVYSVAECIGINNELPHKVKTLMAVEKVKTVLGIEACIGINIQSQLPCGKGMASSSADIAAACQAVGIYFNKCLTTEDIAAIALSIEPTDGIFYQGIVMFDHVDGLLCRYLGEPPPIKIAVFDVGGEVDTTEFNKRQDLKQLNKLKEPIIRKAVRLVAAGIKYQAPRFIGMGATLSARANQSILPKVQLEAVITIAEHWGAVGVNIAHSGTVVGVLFDERYMQGHQNCIEEVVSMCQDINYLMTCSLISGGLEIIKDDHYDAAKV